MASPAFRRRQEDLGRMATELMALVQDGKIRPNVAEPITMEAIPKEGRLNLRFRFVSCRPPLKTIKWKDCPNSEF